MWRWRRKQAHSDADAGPTAERAVDAGADGQLIETGAVEFDRVVPPSGNLWVARRQFWLGPARAGQTVRFWASADVLHLGPGEKFGSFPTQRSVGAGSVCAVALRLVASAATS